MLRFYEILTLLEFFICLGFYKVTYLECYRCDIEFEVICRRMCPYNCRKCSTKDLCLSCVSAYSDNLDTASFICTTNCKNQCFLNRTCLKGCGVMRDVYPHRPIVCITKETCFKCFNMSEECLQCKPGLFGSLCDKTCGYCQRKSKEIAECDMNTGDCKDECKYGYFGRRCDKKCKHCRSVLDSEMCEKLTGNCVKGCIPGWFYDRCNESCSKNCLHETCNQINGYCLEGCTAGRYGKICENKCNNKCVQRSCDRFNGQCTHGCKARWFGETCESACSDKCLHRSCQWPGNCSYGCLPGWFGDTCEMSCSHACSNKSCDQSNGSCDFGCINGFYGVKCNKWDHASTTNSTHLNRYNHKDENENRNNSDSDRMTYALAGTIAGVFATVLCCMIFMSVKRAIISFKRYDYLNNSLRRNAQPIYDEITQTDDTSLGTVGNLESNANIRRITGERLSSTVNATTSRDHSDYEEIQLNSSEISVHEDNERVYYLHPIN